MATDKTTLFTALCKAQQSFKPAIKDTANPFFKSKYADLASIWDACKDALAANDLFISQSISVTETGPVLITKVFHISGEHIESTCPIICGKQNDPQAFGSAVTYTRRYSLAPLLGIITDDDDGEGAMVRPAANVQQKQQKPVPATADQTTKIAELLDHEFISPDIQSRGIAALKAGLNYSEAETKIKQLEGLIAKRTLEAA
jgi:hypothetical protein